MNPSRALLGRIIINRVPTGSLRMKLAKPAQSLADQLFSDSWMTDASIDKVEQPQAPREVPPLPLDVLKPTPQEALLHSESIQRDEIIPEAISISRNHGPWIKNKAMSRIVAFDRASENLTVADFRRLVPQGRHLEGWALDAGDIRKIVPMRKLRDLEQTNMYFLYFSTSESATAFCQHVMKLDSMAKHFAPQPPFFEPIAESIVVDGINVASGVAALQAVAGHQPCLIEQLTLPLQPATEAFLEVGGLRRLKTRTNQMPFELRMTLEGPSVRMPVLRSILQKSGEARGLQWSGRSDVLISIRRWNQDDSTIIKNYRPADPIYIVGFPDEDVGMSFLHYWHRRPLGSPDDSALALNGDLPPVVNLKVLW